MTINQLAKEICAREGLKKQVDIAQVKEILGHLAYLIVLEGEYGSTIIELLKLGEKRHKRNLREIAKRAKRQRSKR